MVGVSPSAARVRWYQGCDCAGERDPARRPGSRRRRAIACVLLRNSRAARAQGEVPEPHLSTDEEVVYLKYGVQGFGLRPADGGAYRYYEVGIEHLAFEVDDRDEVDGAYRRCVSAGGTIQSPPEQHYVDDGEDYSRSSRSIRTASGSRSSSGRARRTAECDPEVCAARRLHEDRLQPRQRQRCMSECGMSLEH